MRTLNRYFSVLVVVLVGCSAPVAIRDTSTPRSNIDPSFISEEVLAEVQAIKFDDVSALEAEVLAKHYFRNTYGGCGMWGPIQDRKDIWFYPCAVGIVGAEKPGITIAKHGVLITCSRGPTVTNSLLLAKPIDPVWPMSPLNLRRK